jgi:TatD DNase family protein
VIDTHAHLDALEEPEAALVRAREAGVARVLTIGTGIDSCLRALALARAYGGVHAVLGIDPHQAGTEEAARLDELRALLGEPGVVAVGECGLDYHYGAERNAEQRELFEAQLALARERQLPVVVHTRAANTDTASILDAHEGTVVMHCFSEPELLEAALERGWYVSFAGNVTYPRADDLRAAAARVPADRLLAETDSPYLAPQPVRGRRNEPAFVRHTIAALAAARGEDADALAAQVDANATAAFGLPT